MSSFDRVAFQRVLDNDNFFTREKYRELGKDPLFTPRLDISLDYSRELALARLRRVA